MSRMRAVEGWAEPFQWNASWLWSKFEETQVRLLATHTGRGGRAEA